MKNEEIISFIYFLEDKIDEAYIVEVRKAVINFVNRLNNN